MNWIKNFSIIVFVSAFSLEALSFVATKLNLFLVNETPNFYSSSINKDLPDIVYGRTEMEKWGAWHSSNATFRHSSSCFNVTLSFNEVGARDETFIEVPSSALVLLGDSFAEGYGVERREMSEYLMEQELNLSILNFGASGNFGPLQQLLIYDEFKDIPHQGLIIYFLPFNDFTDNDVEIWKAKNHYRYRPYFSSKGDPLVPFYFPTAVPRDELVTVKAYALKRFIKDNFWSSNALRSALKLISGEAEYLKKRNEFMPSFYYDATELQQLNILAAYEAILDIAENKNILFVIIPSEFDIDRYRAEPNPQIYHSTIWYQAFINFKKRNEQRVEVLDLMDYLPSSTKNLFFNCDSHWSPQGNIWAAKVISNFIKDKNLFEIDK